MVGEPPRGAPRDAMGPRDNNADPSTGYSRTSRAGRSRALVVRGEPGIGKSALLGYAADTARDFRVARADGVESEIEMPFAALHQLCGRMLSGLDRLPGPQREALGVAFGLHPGSAPDRFLSAWLFWACCRTWPPASRCCA